MRNIGRVAILTLLGLVFCTQARAQALSSQLRPRITATTDLSASSLGVSGTQQTVTVAGSIGQTLIGYISSASEVVLGAGVWHLHIGRPVVAVSPRPPGGELALDQNYPNPFLNTTLITFTLPKRDRISLRVFDITGRAISTLVDETLESGEYEVVVTAHSLSPGLYFYRMTTSGDVITRKLLLLDSGGANN